MGKKGFVEEISQRTKKKGEGKGQSVEKRAKPEKRTRLDKKA